jgi:hypothetical protein
MLPLVVAALSACTSYPVEQLDANTYSIGCPGSYYDWSGCFKTARKVCAGATYDIVSQLTNEGSSGVGVNDWSSRGSMVSRTMVVRCSSKNQT